ncbi:MAG: hypothetical protein JXJ04_12190 [Spirochaetales bacterium]|nr:hypothetical protein [Spirochaetales bacterium]
MKRRISSAWTFIYKFPFPVLWIGGFLIGTIMLITKNGLTDLSITSLVVTIAGALLLYWVCMRLKVVKIDNEKLYISDYFEEIEIEKSNIAKVTENVFININPVWIHFKNPTIFGKKIMFMPKARIFSFFSSHPVVEELRKFAHIDK